LQAFGIIGRSGSGKTTLITALIPILKQRGLRVATIKHAHHSLSFDQPGKDSHRHAAAGAAEVILAADSGFALFSSQPATLPDLLGRLAPTDIVLVEGFKNDPIPKLEVYRIAQGQPPLWPEIQIRAVATDALLPGCALPVLDLGAVSKIADFITSELGLNKIHRVRE
jgi:molybdopterin-guanine dinucleotide biosynthesis protein B